MELGEGGLNPVFELTGNVLLVLLGKTDASLVDSVTALKLLKPDV